jgi:hypothetical protein
MGSFRKKGLSRARAFPRAVVEVFAVVILPELYHGVGGDSEIDVWKWREANVRFRENRCEGRVLGSVVSGWRHVCPHIF